MYQGQIIDTHMHLWDLANGYSWLPHAVEGRLNHHFLMKDYLEMSKNQFISQMVHIQCGGFEQSPVLETKWVQEQADKYGAPQAIIAFAQLDAPDIEATLRDHCQYPNIRGIRMPLNYGKGGFGANRADYMTDKAWRKGYALLSKYQLLFEMQIYDSQIHDACEIAKTYPDIPIVLEHLAWPVLPTLAHFKEWKNQLALIAQYSNVFLKISGIGYIFQKNDEERIFPYVKEALRLFGPNRCMIGSNCPPDRIFISFDEIFYIYKKALAEYADSDQQKVFYGNAKRLYKI